MKWHYKFIFLSLLLATAITTGWTQQIPSKPNPPRLVNDYAGVLNAGNKQALEQQLVAVARHASELELPAEAVLSRLGRLMRSRE